VEQNAVTCLSVWAKLSSEKQLGAKYIDFLLSVWNFLSSEKMLEEKYSAMFVYWEQAIRKIQCIVLVKLIFHFLWPVHNSGVCFSAFK
jgi:hypothetical protein